MRPNNCVTRKLSHISTQTHQLRTCNAVCICICLFTFSAAETAPKAVRLVRQTQLKNTFVFDRKQFSEITIVREHKRV